MSVSLNVIANTDCTDVEGGSDDGGREMEVTNASSESVAGTRKGLSSEGCRGSVFERLNASLGIVGCWFAWSLSPHVNCRRRGFEDEPGITREEPVAIAEVPSTTDSYLSASDPQCNAAHILSCTAGRALVIVCLNTR